MYYNKAKELKGRHYGQKLKQKQWQLQEDGITL